MNRSISAFLLGYAVLFLVSIVQIPVQAATVSSVSISPTNPAITAGHLQSFTATGTFSDGSVRTITDASISAGQSHVCAIVDGSVECWGSNIVGQLGNGTTTNSTVPVSVIGISTATAIAAGSQHSCALLADGSVQCWGFNSNGQLGNGTTSDSSIPVTVSGISTATAITAGTDFSCALLADKTVKCWGVNKSGELGEGGNVDSSSPLHVSGASGVMAISAGRTHACAVLGDGSVVCWGDNSYGQLGNGTTTASFYAVTVSGISTATSVATGDDHTCALLADGSIQCWGNNFTGEIGNGKTSAGESTPVTVGGITTATAIMAGALHTCALLSDGTVKCWGNNSFGQLGDGTTTNSLTPVSVNGINTATAITAARNRSNAHDCALLQDGSVKCWGSNDSGQLGSDGGPIGGGYSSTPVQVKLKTIATAVAVGNSALVGAHICVITYIGSVQCWGRNNYGQLGNGSITDAPAPVGVYGISTATAVAVGDYSSCALLADGSVKCWGANDFGQLGNGTKTSYSTPVSVTGISTATSIAMSGGDFGDGPEACALLADGTVKCWGKGSSTPITVSGIANAKAITLGQYVDCALIAGGSVKCWGYNFFGALGNGDYVAAPTSFVGPVNVVGISTATAISGGGGHTCVLLMGGSVKCWGKNSYGQLGNGVTTASTNPVPVTVSGFNLFTSIAAGEDSTCGIVSGGSIKCWGYNIQGQLGIGTVTDTSTPVLVSGITNAASVVVGTSHSCALLSNGVVKCWGAAGLGELGNNYQAYGLVQGLKPASVKTLQWRSDDNSVATINSNGLVYSLSTGQAEITAMAESVSSNAATLLVGYAVGGTVSGLSGGLVLEDNNSDDISLSQDGNFTFPSALASGALYSVTVAAQPTGQTCSVSNGSGAVSSQDISNVAVTCAAIEAAPSTSGGSGGGGGSISPLMLGVLGLLFVFVESRRLRESAKSNFINDVKQ